jgi:ABC-type branched-subunit amino acid transport system substrate-binding protein
MTFSSLKRSLASVAFVVAALTGATAGAQTLEIGVIGPLTGGSAPWGNGAAVIVDNVK